MSLTLSWRNPDRKSRHTASNAITISKPQRQHLYRLALALPALLLCGVAAAREPHQYTVTIDYLLSRLWVEARFSSTVGSVSARARNAGKYLIDVRGCEDPPQIWMRNRRMMLPEDGIDCLNYTVDLKQAAKDNRHNRTLAAGNVIVSPSAWLWRPELTGTTQLEVRFRLPENVQVAVPWQQIDSTGLVYRLGRSPESSDAPAVFGSFDSHRVEVPGAVLRVSLLRNGNAMDREGILNWVAATATDVSLAYGRFPNPAAQVVVIPVGDSRGKSDSAVPFGRVVRDGGEAVELFVDETRPIDDYLSDWTATHEFSHLMVPFFGRRHRWVSEGFAQYYQNVLLARSGAYDELYAWQRLYEGYERGRRSRPELSPNEAAEGGLRTGLMKIYWSGAALALIADVTLRERSGGEESLDLLLDRFQSCCLPTDRTWTAQEFFSKLDSFVSEPVMMPLYRRYADTAGFPDIVPVFERLGLAVSDGKVRIRRSGELREIRVAITETDAATAHWRQQLAAN